MELQVVLHKIAVALLVLLRVRKPVEKAPDRHQAQAQSSSYDYKRYPAGSNSQKYSSGATTGGYYEQQQYSSGGGSGGGGGVAYGGL